MRKILDLTPEERLECFEEYTSIFLLSRQSEADVAHLKIQLSSLGYDSDEVVNIIKTLQQPPEDDLSL